MDPDYKDGEQMRDFVYVKDAVKNDFCRMDKEINGLYNLGQGKARTWNDLVFSIFNALEMDSKIEYIDMPEHLSPKYQYFTEANLKKIRSAGYDENLFTLEGKGLCETDPLPGKYLGE